MYNLALCYMMPEIIIGCMACIILLLHLYIGKNRAWLSLVLALAAIAAAGVCTVVLRKFTGLSIFRSMFVVDDFSIALKLIIYFSVFVNFTYASKYILNNFAFVGEYFALALFSMLGMMILVSADNFLSLYLGLELLALPIYALITISPQYYNSSEAAMKYFVMGAMASGLLLYGISLLYGSSGGIEFHVIAREFLGQAGTPNLALQFGMIFVLAGVAFKLGAVPFHMWLPDVYQGAPLPVTMFIGTAPKVAAFGMTMRILANVFPENVADWQILLSFMAVLSLVVGSLAALMQTNIKRLLAYSTISHTGFILLGIIAGVVSGIAPSLFYVIAYVMVVLATFGLIAALSKNGVEVEKISDLKGLGKKSPYISFLLLIVLFSLAGIPPTIGFYAKLFILNSLLEQGNLGLAITAVIMSVIGAYYYLRIIKVIYFDEENDSLVIPEVKMPFASYTILSIHSFAALFFGLMPAPILVFCNTVLPY